MTFWGILAGLLTALLQSVSYIFSAAYLQKYRSSLELLVFSQLVMGAFCLPTLPFLLPPGLEGKYGELIGFSLLWVFLFSVGQVSFFNAIRAIEASRMSSLLGLKIIVLSLITVFIFREPLSIGCWVGVLLCSLAAVGMNWSGGARFTLGGIGWLALMLVAFALTDMTETRLVTLPEGTGVIRSAIGIGAICYAFLGVATLPFLVVFHWNWKKFVDAAPFAFAWYWSQVALLVCFGFIGTVFGNVVQSSRGLISIGFGILLLKFGLGKFDSEISPQMWRRRIAAGMVMTLGIVLYSIFR